MAACGYYGMDCFFQRSLGLFCGKYNQSVWVLLPLANLSISIRKSVGSEHSSVVRACLFWKNLAFVLLWATILSGADMLCMAAI